MTVKCPSCDKPIAVGSGESGGWRGRCPYCKANLDLTFDVETD